MKTISKELEELINLINNSDRFGCLSAYWESGDDYGIDDADTILVVDMMQNGNIIIESEDENEIINFLKNKYNIF